MKRIVSSREMKDLDRYTIEEMGVPSCVLMERAALQVVNELEKVFKDRREDERILCVCGSGNNGGDGVAIARILHMHGFRTDIFLVGDPERRTEELKRQLSVAANYHVPVVNNLEEQEYTTIVDAIFGVGLTRPVEGAYGEVIRCLNRMDAWKVAVDLPSGINGDTGEELGAAFQADLTVTFAYRKAGLCLYPGRKIAGKTVVADVGIYGTEEDRDLLMQMEETDLKILPARSADGHKGTFGRVLVVAGSPGMCGAAYLSAAGAFAAGAGMVKIMTPEVNRIPLQTMLPEAMVCCETDPKKEFAWSDILIAGPGLGRSADAVFKVQWFFEAAAQTQKKLILDADGLNLLAEHPEWKKYLGSHVVLTPHMGEMSRLSRHSIKEIQNDRISAAQQLAAETGAVCVLKDACTVTAAPDGQVWLSLCGNPGMATAGSGDVLSGVLAGTACMYLPEKDRCTDGMMTALGVMLHAMGGDQAASEKGMAGMRAGDIAQGVSKVMHKLESTRISDRIR